jgi:hypothetical protein
MATSIRKSDTIELIRAQIEAKQLEYNNDKKVYSVCCLLASIKFDRTVIAICDKVHIYTKDGIEKYKYYDYAEKDSASLIKEDI